MNVYQIIGESREVGSIGEPNSEIVNICAESSKAAYDQFKEHRYADNREHVHVREIWLLDDDHRTLVEPRAYL